MTAVDEVRRLALRTLMPGFEGTELPGWVRDALRDGLGSVALYGPNVVDSDQVARLCAELREERPRVVIALDEEGGDVTRLHAATGSPQPGNALLGRLDDVERTRASAAAIGAELAVLGIDLDLAPVVDVNSTPDNPVIGTRSFGADPALVARHAAAYVEGLQATGVAACAKHFPGHGDTTGDSHHTLPVVGVPADVLRSRELVPFAAAVAAGTATVMTAAVVVPALDPDRPATFSPVLLNEVLRGELGFTGAIVSDALDMAGASATTGIPEAAVRALAAGCDLLCLGYGTGPELLGAVVDRVVDAVASGRLARERLVEAAASVDRLAGRWSARPDVRSGYDALPDSVVASAFDLTGHAVDWIAGTTPVAFVQIETPTNVAVGPVPWGVAALGLGVDETTVPPGARVAVVGRDVGPDHPARAAASRLSAAGHDVLLVECGWPRGPVDVVTWGGSRAIAEALVGMLTGVPTD